MREDYLPFALPDLGSEELEQVTETLQSGWITTGPKVREFETRFAACVGAKHAVAVNSCTAALHLALEAAGVKRNDFVITSPYTFAATAEVIHYLGAVPVFVDIEPKNLNIDVTRLKETLRELEISRVAGVPARSAAVRKAVERRTPRALQSPSKRAGKRRLKAVVPVHMAGHPCNMAEITRMASTFGLSVVEDAAHAFPASYRGRRIGGFEPGTDRQAACFSFYATKPITTGEGGMLTTNNDQWAERYRVMRLHGISKDAWKRYSVEGNWYYEIQAPGFKYNMPDLAGAVGLAQLSKAERIWKRRTEMAATYSDVFSRFEELEVPTVGPDIQHSWHLYLLRLNLDFLSIDRDEFISELKRRRICASVHFIPLHLHPFYRSEYGYEPEDFPVAFTEFKREVSLPIYTKMTDEDVQDVVTAVTEVVTRFSRKAVYAVAGL